MTFTLYTSSVECGNGPTSVGAAVPLAGGSATSGLTTLTPIGIAYVVSYSGDSIYAPATGTCEGVAPLATPAVNTDVVQVPSGEIVTFLPVGTSVEDTVTVSGGTGNPAPTGKVTFTVFIGNMTCAAGSSTAGMPVPLAAGSATSAISTIPSGGLSYEASYLGDGTYAPTTSACEPVQVTPTITGITPPTTNLTSLQVTVSGSGFASEEWVTLIPPGSTCGVCATFSPSSLTPSSLTVDLDCTASYAMCAGSPQTLTSGTWQLEITQAPGEVNSASNPWPLLVTQSPDSTSAEQVTTNANPSTQTTATVPNVTATAPAGAGTIAVAQYTGDPTGGAPGLLCTASSTGCTSSNSSFYDVYVSPGSTFGTSGADTVVIDICDSNSSDVLQYYNGSMWVRVENSVGPLCQ